MRLLLIIFVLIPLTACSVFSRPREKTFDERMAMFPRQNLPLQSPVEIVWDDHMIPFVKAENDDDCAFALGLVHAHLRLGQMALMREAVYGRLSRSAGPMARDIDQSIRILNPGKAVPEIEKSLPDHTRKWLSEFARGVNYYQEHTQELPVEFRVMDLDPEPWTVADILTVGRLISADVNWFTWFRWLELEAKPWWKEFFEQRLAFGTSSVTSELENDPLKVLFDANKSGSNAWALAPERTDSLGAVLASDPHLGLTMPNLWILAGYRCPSYEVTGLMFPGIPAVMLGRNRAIAWGSTNMRAASSDVYEIRPENNIPIETHTETIPVRWWFDREITIRTTPIGPVVSDAPLLKAGERTLVMRWVGHSPSDEVSAFLAANRATNWEEFRQAFADYAVSGQNLVYADTLGHIGLLPAVALPVRNYDKPPSLILPADDAGLQWKGLLKTPDLPVIFDPPRGYVASANNQPVETTTPIGFFFSANDRIERLHEMLGAETRLGVIDIRRIQTDVRVLSALPLRDAFVTAAGKWLTDPPKSTDREQRFLETLKEWNGDYRRDSQAPVLFQLLQYHLVTVHYHRTRDKDYAGQILGSDEINKTLLNLLAEGEADNALADDFRQAWQKAVSDADEFATWGDMHRLRLQHYFGSIPLVGKRYRFGDYPVDGSYNTLNKTAHQVSNETGGAFYGANARFYSILNDPDDNHALLLGGQDGWVGSPAFGDQVNSWLTGEYISLPLTWDAARQKSRVGMSLKPRNSEEKHENHRP